MPKFRVVTPKGASFTVAGGGYDYEKEALAPIGAEIIEAPANEAEFIAAARTADAIYAKGMPITKAVIDALENCKLITLGTVGVDSVDVKAATARGIPVTNVPDTFIEEVADHAMMLLLAGFRRLLEQDRMVREGRWKEGRPALLKIPRLMGLTPESDDMVGGPPAINRIDGLSIEEWRDRALKAEAELAQIEEAARNG